MNICKNKIFYSKKRTLFLISDTKLKKYILKLNQEKTYSWSVKNKFLSDNIFIIDEYDWIVDPYKTRYNEKIKNIDLDEKIKNILKKIVDVDYEKIPLCLFNRNNILKKN